MQLFHFLVVIVSLSCGSLPASDQGFWLALQMTLAVVVAWSLLSHLGSYMIAAQVKADTLEPLVGAKWLEKQLDAFRWLSLGMIVMCLAGFGPARNIESLPILKESMSLQAMVLLMPGLLMMLATWSAEHAYGVRLGYTTGGFKNHIRSLWLSFRSSIGWLIAPVVLVLGMTDLIGLLPISDSAAMWLSVGGIGIFIVMVIPRLVRRLFKTDPIDEQTEQWVSELLTAAGVGKIRCVRWNTENRAFNAMVAGFIRRYRTLFLSDRLIDELPQEQIAMVVLHEVAHVRRYHVPLRMLAILPAWIAGSLISDIAGDSQWATALGSAGAILLTLLVLRIVAYRSERDADVQACHLAAKISASVANVPADYDTACETLCTALSRVTEGHEAAQKASWLHPSIADRIAWMRRHRDVPVEASVKATASVC